MGVPGGGVSSSAPTDTDAFLALVDALRSRGATRVRMGELEVELAPKPAAPAVREPERVETPAEKAKREAREYDAILFASAGGPPPEVVS